MKKNLLALFATAAVAFASSAMAAPALITATPVDSTACAILGDTVKLNLSKGVSGAYNCDETRNAINVGACHASGSRGTTLTCAQVGVDANGDATYNNGSCNDTNVGTDIQVTAPSYRGFRASTTGGSVGAQSLSANCTTTTVMELVNFQ